jgi:hypothetical protein
MLFRQDEVKESSSFHSLITRLFEGDPDGVGDAWLKVLQNLSAAG